MSTLTFLLILIALWVFITHGADWYTYLKQEFDLFQDYRKDRTDA